MTRPFRIIAAILCAGLALQALLWSRQWVYGDQYGLLEPALELLDANRLPPYAKTTSGGGRIPGALLPLLVGLPLRMWADYRAPALLIGLFHVAAAAVLSICLGRALGARFAAAYLSVYWLSPWRLYHSGFLWEPAYVFLPAALHLASAYRLRVQRHLGWSMLLAATLMLAVQLHTSFVVLALLTALLAARRLIRIDVRGIILGLLAGGLTLAPTLQALLAGTLPRMVPQETEDFSRVFVGLLNLLKGFAYWLRLGSLDIGRRLRQTSVGAADGADPSLWTLFVSGLTMVLISVSIVSILLALQASWRYFRRRPSGGAEDTADRASPATWFRAYAWWCLVAMCAAAAVSPVPVQGWHIVIAFHAACLPMAVWLQAAFWGSSSLLRTMAASFVILEVVIALLLAFGHPMYRPLSGDELIRQDLPDGIRRLIPDQSRHSPGQPDGADRDETPTRRGGGPIRATGLPKRVTSTGWRVLPTRSSTASQAALNDEICISSIFEPALVQIPGHIFEAASPLHRT